MFQRTSVGTLTAWLVVLASVGNAPRAAGQETDPLDALRTHLQGRLAERAEVDERDLEALTLEGRCTAVPCRGAGTDAGPLSLPLYLAPLHCRVLITLNGSSRDLRIAGEGIGATCAVAARDAPLQVAEALARRLEAGLLEAGHRRRLAEMRAMLGELDANLEHVAAGRPAGRVDAYLEDMARAISSLEGNGRAP